MAWKRQSADSAWVAGDAPFISDTEYSALFISTFKTVLVATIEREGPGNQPFGKFVNDKDGHAEVNFISALRANDWVFDAGYHEIVVRINNSPCSNCCALLEQYMDEVTERFPNTTMVIEAANIYKARSTPDANALADLARHPNVRVDYWNVALEAAQNGAPPQAASKETARINKTLRTADRTNGLG